MEAIRILVRCCRVQAEGKQRVSRGHAEGKQRASRGHAEAFITVSVVLKRIRI
jgi:hypothetical protein